MFPTWDKGGNVLTRVYLVLVTLGICFIIPPTREFIRVGRVSDAKLIAGYPVMSYDTIRKESEEILDFATKSRGQIHAIEYVRRLNRLNYLQAACQKAEKEQPSTALDYRTLDAHIRFAEQQLIGIGRERIYPDEDISAIAQEYAKTHPAPQLVDTGADYSEAGWMFLAAYLGIALLTTCHYIIQIPRNGGIIWLEMLQYKFWLCTLVFPYGWFKYPADLKPAQQLRRLCEFVCWATLQFFTVCAGFMGMGVAKAAEKPDTNPNERGGDKKEWLAQFSTRSKNFYLGSFVAESFYPGWVQQSSLTISRPESGNLLTKGLSLNLWSSGAINTRPLSSGFASEVDVSVSWNGRIRGVNLGLGLSYQDVFPVRALPRGDVVNTTISIGHTFTGKQWSAEPYLFNVLTTPVKGSTPARGVIAHLGARLAWSPTSRLTIASNPYLIHDSGAYGLKEAWVTMTGVDVGIRLTKHLVFHPVDSRFVFPLSVSDGRKVRAQYGFGIDYNFSF